MLSNNSGAESDMDIRPILKKTQKAGRLLNSVDSETIKDLLICLADQTLENTGIIISENRKDLALMEESDPRYDRLLLTEERIAGIAKDIRNVAVLASPLGRKLYEYRRPDGLAITRIAVPFGVIGIIYEARPNVTFDVFSLCIKSGNACILKGGSDAIHSNKAIVGIIKDVLIQKGIDQNVVNLLPSGRDETMQLLNAGEYVDLIIPRGGKSLIDFVRQNSGIPVIETGAGICHTYFDEYGHREKGRKIIHNAKTRRVSVCNALDCLIIHEKRLDDLEYLVEPCSASGVIIYADVSSHRALKGKYPDKLLKKAVKESFGTEFLSYKMAVKTVKSIDDAIGHINRYGSRHSEAIITESPEHKKLFISQVDASSVYTNASTSFTDGAEFGLGAEIGISTQKLHARGPMALEALTTSKWIISGNGHIR